MKCTTCRQEKLATINNRIFCVNCGQQAADRLRSFQAGQTQQESPDNVLDLSQASAASPKPAGSSKGHGPGHGWSSALHTELPGQQTVSLSPETIKSLQGMSAKTIHKRAQITAGDQTVPSSAPAKQVNHALGSTTRTESSTAAATTVMQPHQTYTVKDPVFAPQQAKAADNHSGAVYDPVMTSGFGAQLELRPKKKKTPKPLARLSLPNFFKRSALRIGTVGLSILLLTGYITYLNYPSIAIRVAASRASINATLPEYLPTGYRFSGPITYGPGKLTVTFNSGAATITLLQATTRWDSESLLEDYVKYQTSTWETFRESGLTIYTFDGRWAVWVNGGMLYSIESSEIINKEDIVKMASSL